MTEVSFPKNSVSSHFNRALIGVVFFIFSIFSFCVITYNINRIDRDLAIRLESIIEAAHVTMGPAVWELHYEYLKQSLDSLFINDIVVYAEVLNETEESLMKRIRPAYAKKSFDFFVESNRFKSKQVGITQYGQRIGTVRVVITRESIFKELTLSTVSAIGIMVLLISAIVITTIISTRRYIISPLIRLKESAGSIAAGNLDTVIQKDHPDEIGVLANDLDVMRQAIKALFKDAENAHARLEEYAKTLELRVEERTRELSETLKKEEYANRMIMKSIRYAEKIQTSLLPTGEILDRCFEDYFIIWKPREIVGGDIYLIEDFPDGYLVAVIDCTGHGIPAAFMTMIAGTVFKRVASGEHYHNPAEILRRLNIGIKTSLYQSSAAVSGADDGMDAGICFVNRRGRTLTFAGAKTPLIYINRDGLNVIKGDRQSLGYKDAETDYAFTNHQMPIHPEMAFYLLSDGYTGQPGGPKYISLGRQRLQSLLQDVRRLPFDSQKEKLMDFFMEWKGNKDQKDDVTMVGFGFHSAGS